MPTPAFSQGNCVCGCVVCRCNEVYNEGCNEGVCMCNEGCNEGCVWCAGAMRGAMRVCEGVCGVHVQ